MTSPNSAATPQTTQDSWTRKFATDAVMLAVLSAFGYWIAYAYETGYASHFGYPTYFISPTLNIIVAAIASLAAAMVGLTLPLLDALKTGDATRSKHARRFIFAAIFALLVGSLYVSSNYDWRVLWRVLFAVVIYFVYRWTSASEAKHGVALPMSASLFFLALLAAMLVHVGSTFAGLMAAKDQRVFYFLTSKPDYAVVRIYDGVAVAVRYDTSKKAFTGDYVILKFGDELKDFGLKRVAINETRLPVMKSGEQ